MPSARLTRGRAARGRVQVQELARLAPGAAPPPAGGARRRPRRPSLPAHAPAAAGTAGRPGSPVPARSPRRNARQPAARIAQAEDGQSCGIQRVPDLAGVLQDQHPRTRRQGGNQRAEAMAGGRAQRSQRIRGMGRLLEGAQCATGGGASSHSQNVIFPTNGGNLFHPLRITTNFCRSMKNTIVPPLNSRPSAPKTGMSPSLYPGFFSCSLASTDR